MKNILSKLNHWLIVLIVLFLGITGVFGCTIFHYSTLIPNLEFAYGVNEIFSGRASQVFIARVVRGLMWDWHYLAGIALTILMFISVALNFKGYSLKSLKKNPFPVIFLLLVVILCITGVIRYYRGELSFTSEQDRTWRNLARSVHHYAAWSMLVAFMGHLVHVIYYNARKNKTLISDMFTSKKLHLKSIVFFLATTFLVTHVGQLQANNIDTVVIIKKVLNKTKKEYIEEPNYKQALEFYSGRKGFHMEKREFPNCPYDACKKSNDVVQGFKENGKQYFNIKIHDFKSAKELFDKSIKETKNPFAAEKNLIMLTERINYKSKYYEDYLLKDMKKSLDIDGVEAINKEVQKNMPYITKENDSKIIFRVAEIYEKGYFGVPVNSLKALKMYKWITGKKDKKNMYTMLAKNKISFMNKRINNSIGVK